MFNEKSPPGLRPSSWRGISGREGSPAMGGQPGLLGTPQCCWGPEAGLLSPRNTQRGKMQLEKNSDETLIKRLQTELRAEILFVENVSNRKSVFSYISPLHKHSIIRYNNK